MLVLSRIYQLSGRLSRRIHPTTLEVGDFYAIFVKNADTEHGLCAKNASEAKLNHAHDGAIIYD